MITNQSLNGRRLVRGPGAGLVLRGPGAGLVLVRGPGAGLVFCLDIRNFFDNLTNMNR